MADNDQPVPTKDNLKDLRETALKETPVKPITPAATVVQEEKKVTPATENPQAEIKQPEVKVEIKAEEKPAPSLEDMPEEEFLKAAEKRGLKISKETLTAEQQRKQSDIEETEKLKFAIENNLITQTGYLEAKATLEAEGSDLTKKEFVKAYKSDNAKATKEEIEQAFNDYYFVQQTVKDKTTNDDGDEVEVDKPKWDERFVSLGEKRRNKEAESIKANAKAVLDNVDSNYANYKTFVTRANDFSKTTEKVLSGIDFSALPIEYKFKDKSINAIVKLDDAAKADVLNYLNTQLAPLVIQSNKQNDVDEISKQVKSYIKEKYSNQVGESLYDLGHTSGLNEGKVGASAPITRELVADGSMVDALSKEVEKRLPPNPLHKT